MTTSGRCCRFSDVLLPALVALLAGQAPGRPALAAPADEEDERALFRRGDRLAGQGDHGGALEAWSAAYQRKVGRLRDLPFRFPVDARLLERKDVRARMLAILAKERPEAKLEADRIALSALGFFPLETDLRKIMPAMLGEEVGGFYDPDEKSLYLIREGPPAEKKSLLGKIFGGGGRERESQRAILAHEIAHALADQHFDLHSLYRSVEKDDDVAFACAALVEGEAMLVMIADEMEVEDASALFRSPLEFMGGAMEVSIPFAAAFATGKAFRRAPLILRESLLAPYAKGFQFCIRVTKDGGWEAVNAAFRKPPLSSEQVLHPEKYLDSQRDAPVVLAFTADCPLGDAWELVKENVVGEFAIEVLLRPKLGILQSSKAAAGWDGDVYRVYRKKGAGDAALFLAWVSTWDSEEEAGEFASGFMEAMAPLDSRGELPGDQAGAEKVWRTEGAVAGVWRKGGDVWFLAAPLSEDLPRLAQWSFEIRRRPKRVRLERFPTSVRFPDDADRPRPRSPATLDKRR